jgi:hypothetical protein
LLLRTLRFPEIRACELTVELGWFIIWNAGPDAHDIEGVLMQIENILKGITEGGGVRSFKKPSSYLKILGARRVT